MGQLTVARVKTLTEAGRYIDGDGLMLVVKPTGAQSWTLRVRNRYAKRHVSPLYRASLIAACLKDGIIVCVSQGRCA